MSQNDSKKEETKEVDKFKDEWMIRPCWIYRDEYDECTCWKGRFHQYFIFGHQIECSAWKEDYENCKIWEENRSEDAYNAIIENETERRRKRLRAHFANIVWKKRDKPPENWNSPLPDWMQENMKVSLLEQVKKEELIKQKSMMEKYCTIM
ncbi:hypothetical protein KPH14_005620 [Odynerus spinipes]|uniref:Synaptic plasticity regulator PANTS n=1 Tax=Odynerus spinipes TaxID=1348599 RepID=A0AAD9RAN6_9HYME|nr:hypothetical protein KPH14_005620 [Odynerus spinipes]